MEDTINAKLVSIKDGYWQLQAEADKLRQEMDDLEELGITEAGIHWRKDKDGNKTILELVYSKDSQRVRDGGRRIEYIGKDPAKIEAAQDRLKRFKDHAKLQEQLKSIQSKLYRVESSLSNLELFISGKQSSFFYNEF